MEKKLDAIAILGYAASLLTILGGLLGGIATEKKMKRTIVEEVAKAVTKE